MDIPTPSNEQLELYLEKWDSLENYTAQESSLKKLFTKTYRRNINLDDVLIKVCSLNDFYSTNIFKPYAVARHIVNLNIDDRIKKNDFTLVNEIAIVQVNETKSINFYSFATKYCSHHKPKEFPIYDYFLERLLMHFQRKKTNQH